MFIVATAIIAAVFWFFRQVVGDTIEPIVRAIVVRVTDYLPVKVIRDEHGIPFLYRYHLFALGHNGPGMCIHHFVKSDPDRGYHDHPWKHSLSFILCGGYSERIVTNTSSSVPSFVTYDRSRWVFNYLNGTNTFHRVIIEEGCDAWTLFAFGPRAKTWNMIGLDNVKKAMSHQVADTDGGWWNFVRRGFRTHVPLKGTVSCAVDIILANEKRNKVLLIRRGRDPYKGSWAFPGGRIDPTDENILAAAQRELAEETSLTNVELNMFETIGNNTRDPRGFVLSIVYTGTVDENVKIKAGDDAVEIKWFDINKLPELAFDHQEILKRAFFFSAPAALDSEKA